MRCSSRIVLSSNILLILDVATICSKLLNPLSKLSAQYCTCNLLTEKFKVWMSGAQLHIYLQQWSQYEEMKGQFSF